MLAADPGVEMAIKLPGKDQYLVKLAGMEHWLKMAPEEQASIQIARGWQSRVADLESGSSNMQVAWMDKVAAGRELGGDGYIVIEAGTNPGQNSFRFEPARGPPTAAKPIAITSGNTTVSGHVDPTTGAMYLRTSALPESIRGNPGLLQKLLRPADLQYIRDKLPDGALSTVHYTIPETRLAHDGGFVGKLRRGNYDAAARGLVNNPRELKTVLEHNLAEQLRQSDRFLAAGQHVKAMHHLNELINIYGHLPELHLRLAVAEIGRGKVQNAARVLNATRPGALPDRAAFFNEINGRLRSSGLSQTERQNLHRVATMADWRDLQARKMVPEGEVRAFVEGEQLLLGYRLAEAPRGQAVSLGAIDVNKAFLYVQDSPGLNNLDWYVSLKQSLDQAVSGDLGTVIHLPRADIAHFNPTVIYTPDEATRFLNVSSKVKTKVTQQAPRTYRAFNSPDDDDEDKKAHGKDEKEQVYLVLARTRTSSQR
jgi:hypothetical protein